MTPNMVFKRALLILKQKDVISSTMIKVSASPWPLTAHLRRGKGGKGKGCKLVHMSFNGV